MVNPYPYILLFVGMVAGSAAVGVVWHVCRRKCGRKAEEASPPRVPPRVHDDDVEQPPTDATTTVMGELIGVGSFGRVYRGNWKGMRVAIKVMEGYDRNLVEMDVSKSLSHDNLVKVLHTTIQETGRASSSDDDNGRSMVKSTLVMEYCDKGTLSGLLVDGSSSSFEFCVNIALDIARGLEYLHYHHIVHGDLKSENILLVTNESSVTGYTAKISDFGFSRRLLVGESVVCTKSIGTITHMAPETMQKGLISYASDVFSFGMIMWELVSRKPLWRNTRTLDIMDRVVNGQRPVFSDTVDPRYQALAAKCWSSQPQARPPLERIISDLNAIRIDYSSKTVRVETL